MSQKKKKKTDLLIIIWEIDTNVLEGLNWRLGIGFVGVWLAMRI